MPENSLPDQENENLASQEVVLQGQNSNNPQIVKNEKTGNKSPALKYFLFGILFVVVLGLFVGGFVMGKNMNNNSQISVSPSPEPNPQISNNNSNNKFQNSYLYYKDKDLALGNLKNSNETILVKGKDSKYASTGDINLSPNKKYLTYITFSDKDIAAFEKNPPIEFHGSDSWELHLLNISDPKSLKDELISNEATYGLGFDKSAYWTPDNSAIYFKKGEDYYKYDLKIKQTTKENLPEYLSFDSAVSPSAKNYAKFDLVSSIPDSLNAKYNLGLYNVNGELTKLLDSDLITEEHSLIFPSENKVYYSIEDFDSPSPEGASSTCSIVEVTVSNSLKKMIESKICPPGFSLTNFSGLKISPNENYLAAIYSEGAPPEKYSGSIFIYDLKTGNKKYIGENNINYSSIYWISVDELVALVPSDRTYSPSPQAYLINIKNDSVKKSSNLDGKNIVALF